MPDAIRTFVSNDEINTALARFSGLAEVGERMRGMAFPKAVRSTPLLAAAYLASRSRGRDKLDLLSGALHRAGAPAPRIMAWHMLVLFDGASLQMAIFHDPNCALQAAEAASAFLLQGAGWLPCAA